MSSIRIFYVVLALISTPAIGEQGWILGDWASNFDDTLEANKHHSSQSVKGVTALKGVFDSVQLRWRVSEDKLEVSDSNGFIAAKRIEMNLMSDDSYEIDMGPTSLTVLKTNNGMCVLFATVPDGVLDSRTLECFRRLEDI
ncbi:MAG: hypothetical protein JJ957_20440 [Pseudomonadales bacterium]|nr:hypothetical protein [Pseudomonadales bacterium]MBO6598012.1 hypothetical protein [Pseudomonadales bacterium]MBO6824538.1 hypothetical protein [Pseudomonadales bacterium]